MVCVSGLDCFTLRIRDWLKRPEVTDAAVWEGRQVELGLGGRETVRASTEPGT